MNILVKTASGHMTVRPDTTWERDNEDLYLPDSVSRLSFTPVIFARICKPGRSIGRKFASRYYDSVGYGILLYPEDYLDGSEEGFACASCLDHTSFLPTPMLPIGELEKGDPFSICRNGSPVFTSGGESIAMIEKAIEEATARIYIRTGDLIAVELQPREIIFDRSAGNVTVTGNRSGKTLVDFKIIVE